MTISRRALLAGATTLFLAAATLGAAVPAHAEDALKVGIIGGEDEDLWALVGELAKKEGLDIEVVTFSDYTLPNEALASGDIDADAFQHVPYLDNQNATRGYDLVPVGYTLVAPIGLYSTKHDSVADLPEGARIGIPNDPSNGGRGLLLLAAQGVITLADGVGILPTVADIVANPRNVEIVELDAGIIGRSLDDLDAAVVNTDWAVKAGLSFTDDRIAVEAIEGNPYRNVIAVRRGSETDPRIQTLVRVYQTEPVAAFLEQRFQGAIVAAW
jgi:D-methionine transport system substrate-binding protein